VKRTIGGPKIYTLFRKPEIEADISHRADLNSLWAFQEELGGNMISSVAGKMQRLNIGLTLSFSHISASDRRLM
jgi:hypothetical protein